MPGKKQSKRYDDVWFRFLGFQEDTPLRGQVLISGRDMKIDISVGASQKYLIAGRAVKHWFEGVNARGPQFPDVHAEWAQVGNIYVGNWVEEGTKFLFSFELPDSDV